MWTFRDTMFADEDERDTTLAALNTHVALDDEIFEAGDDVDGDYVWVMNDMSIASRRTDVFPEWVTITYFVWEGGASPHDTPHAVLSVSDDA